MDRLLTTQEAAERAGVGPTAIKRWSDEGLLKCIRTAGGHRRFREQDVEALIRELSARAGGGAVAEPNDEAVQLVEALIRAESAHEVVARLLSLRGKTGAWFKVAAVIGRVLDAIGARWERDELSILEEHFASEQLSRAIDRVLETIVVAPDGPAALLVCAEGDEHTLGLSCVELCLSEAGWRTRWAGRATPVEEVIACVEEGRVDLVAASASAASQDQKALARWLSRVGSACQTAEVSLIFGGSGAWPTRPSFGLRLNTFEELRAWLVGHDRKRAR